MREQLRQIKLWKVIFAAVGILLVGTGVAFNARAALGNDPIGIIYDGVRNAANLTAEQLGMTSNIVNIVLLVLVFLADRHYVNLGTFIYLIPYGFAVDLGGKLYQALIPAQTQPFRILGAFIGCLLLYVGVAMFITMDMGVDPFTGVVLVLRDRLHMEYRKIKVIFDLCMMVLGFVLGGKLGVITILTAITAGPCIQAFSGLLKKFFESRGIDYE